MNFNQPPKGNIMDKMILIDAVKAKSNEDLLTYYSDLKRNRETLPPQYIAERDSQIALVEGELTDRKVAFEKYR